MKLKVIVLGIRGVPARYGGFETFAEYLCQYLVKRNWSVTVYCQENGTGQIFRTSWKGVSLVHIPVKNTGPLGTIIFDFKSIVHSLSHNGVILTLGYNTAIFSSILRLRKRVNLINMDGVEWKRQKWGPLAKAWFMINERLGCWFGNHLVADNPHIADHLAARVSRDKVTVIPYGGREVLEADERVLKMFGLKKFNYAIVIARAEPENSILEIVRAFSAKNRNAQLVLLGNYTPDTNSYHRKVMRSASHEVKFLGAIYDAELTGALRYFARIYVHGHQVGGTNPSLVESMAAGNAVLAHDNVFNRWVAGDSALYFNDESSIRFALNRLFSDERLIESLKTSSKANFQKNFQWDDVLHYEQLLIKWLQ